MTRKFRHISGLGGQFIKLEGRADWLPVNDAEWQPDAAADAFRLENEQFYALGEHPPLPETDNILLFTREAEALARKKLEAAALLEIARSLQDAQQAYDLEKLIDAIDFHLKQDHLFD